MTRRKKFILLSPLFVAGFLALVALGGEIVRQLWNYLLPPLFGWSQLTFWQALALLALCRILFGGFGKHGSHRSRLRERLAERMGERWETMTPEQRERLRQWVRGRGAVEPPV